MSDYHIKTVGLNMKSVLCVFHIGIPAGNNAVGVAWRTALVGSLGGADSIDSVLLDISSADLTRLKAGELFERVMSVKFSSLALTDAARLTEIRAAYTAAETQLIAEKQITLKYYGYNGDI